MNQKKKADLQRKLTLAQVPKPPADLLEKIKQDIPSHLVMGGASERDRFSRSIFFNTRVAAAVLLVVTSTFLMLQFFSRADHDRVAAVMANAQAPDPRAITHPIPLTLTSQTAATSGPVQVAEYRPVMQDEQTVPAMKTKPAITRNEPVVAFEDDRRQRRDLDSLDAKDEGTEAKENAIVAEAASTVAAAPVTPAPPPPAAPMAKMAAAGTAAPADRAAEGFDVLPQRAARGGRLEDTQPSTTATVFGISIDQHAFERIKAAIERGEQPESANIDVAGLVNYFAGAAKHESHDVRLEAEGSPAPVASDERRMIRVTVDTATADTTAIVATDAAINVDFDGTTVVAHHLIGSDAPRREGTLMKNTSVTAMYEVALAPRGASWQRVATVRLTYHSLDGREHTIEKTLHRRDLAPTWLAASHRHRLASLGAVWGETLKGMAGANDVARRAEELASQAPGDAKARELANAANATSQLHSSTGSAR